MANIIETFEYKGYTCAISENRLDKRDEDLFQEIRDVIDFNKKFHNGYVQIADSPDKVEVRNGTSPFSKYMDMNYTEWDKKISTVELTYSGRLPDQEGYWIGFDTAHAWNFKNPQSQTLESVKKKIKKLIDEIEKKGLRFK